MQSYDLVVVGLGPAGLSVCALAESKFRLSVLGIESAASQSWHAGTLYDFASLQTSMTKDLVSLYDPQSEFSYLSYLWSAGRLEEYLQCGFDSVPRLDFDRYLKWCCSRLESTLFGRKVTGVSSRDGGGFVITTDNGEAVCGAAVCFALGTVPKQLRRVSGVSEQNIVSGYELLLHQTKIDELAPNSMIAVVGGGQTAAEAVQYLLGKRPDCKIAWYFRTDRLRVLEVSAAASGLFTSDYRSIFAAYPKAHRDRLLASQIHTSDGISPSTLREIFQACYRGSIVNGEQRISYHPLTSVLSLASLGSEIQLSLENTVDSSTSSATADLVVEACGRTAAEVPSSDLYSTGQWLSSSLSGELSIDANVVLPGLYSLGRGRSEYGLSDSNLSIVSLRAGQVLESVSSYLTRFCEPVL